MNHYFHLCKRVKNISIRLDVHVIGKKDVEVSRDSEQKSKFGAHFKYQMRIKKIRFFCVNTHYKHVAETERSLLSESQKE